MVCEALVIGVGVGLVGLLLAGVGDDCEAVVPQHVSKEQRLRKEARSLLRRMTHLPRNTCRWICQETKVKAKQARRRDPTVAHAPRRSGDPVLGDHLVMPGEDHYGSIGETAGLLLKDVGTHWRDCVATADKGSLDSQRVMREFVGKHKVSEFYFDCSEELKAAAKAVQRPHALATPHRPSSRGAIAREV